MASSSVTFLFLCAFALLFLSSSAQNNHLLNRNRLKAGEFLRQDGFTFILQKDGNLVLYDIDKPIWASGTNGQDSSYLILQDDGNLVIYTKQNKPIWASNTNGQGSGNYAVLLQKDGNVVLYTNPLWASGTNRVGSLPVVIASPRNGTVGITGAQQNKVNELFRSDA